MLSSSQLDNQPANILSGILDNETAIHQMKPCLYFVYITHFFSNSSFQKDFEKADI